MTPNRAGLVIFNLAGQVLLTTPFGRKDEWVFPKGHIEKDETPEETAKREALEECGIVATPLTKVGLTAYEMDKETVVIEWWTGVAIRKVREEFYEGYAEEDFRYQKWVFPDEALELLTYNDLKEILKKSLCWI
ncbi:MAG: NUDIX domain-containing protein [Candidatus Altimarinota bacterium]